MILIICSSSPPPQLVSKGQGCKPPKRALIDHYILVRYVATPSPSPSPIPAGYNAHTCKQTNKPTLLPPFSASPTKMTCALLPLQSLTPPSCSARLAIRISAEHMENSGVNPPVMMAALAVVSTHLEALREAVS